MKTMGAIIAGGESRRMGQEKSFIRLGGKSMIQHVIDRLKPQVDHVIINANGNTLRFYDFNCDVTLDRYNTGTPLAGLHAAMLKARDRGFDHVLTVPCDTPLLPTDLMARLSVKVPAIAASRGQSHYIIGLWPVSLLNKLESHLNEMEVIRVQDWASSCGAEVVTWEHQPHDPFMNINTPDDVTMVETIFATQTRLS